MRSEQYVCVRASPSGPTSHNPPPYKLTLLTWTLQIPANSVPGSTSRFWSLATKMSLALTVVIILPLLEWYGFSADPTVQSSATGLTCVRLYLRLGANSDEITSTCPDVEFSAGTQRGERSASADRKLVEIPLEIQSQNNGISATRLLADNATGR